MLRTTGTVWQMSPTADRRKMHRLLGAVVKGNEADGWVDKGILLFVLGFQPGFETGG